VESTNASSIATSTIDDFQVDDTFVKNASQMPIQKQYRRIVWEVCYRICGVALVVLSWYACHTGCKLYEASYHVKYLIVCLYTSIAVWGVISIQLGLVILLLKINKD
jgi:hypothetical protein